MSNEELKKTLREQAEMLARKMELLQELESMGYEVDVCEDGHRYDIDTVELFRKNEGYSFSTACSACGVMLVVDLPMVEVTMMDDPYSEIRPEQGEDE
jgi:hypothetical protein